MLEIEEIAFSRPIASGYSVEVITGWQKTRKKERVTSATAM
jgi:hypothetical protein